MDAEPPTVEPPMRRRFQFRLRTLMIVVTLLAAVCWVVVDRQRLIDERDEEVQNRQQVQADAARVSERLKWFQRQLHKTAAELLKAKETQP